MSETAQVIQTDVAYVTDGRLPSGERVMTIGEFRDSGLLMEINRFLLHPLGLSLAFEFSLDPAEQEQQNADYHIPICIIDSRDDPEGFVFAKITEHDVERLNVIHDEMARRWAYRTTTLGYSIQPVEVVKPS